MCGPKYNSPCEIGLPLQLFGIYIVPPQHSSNLDIHLSPFRHVDPHENTPITPAWSTVSTVVTCEHTGLQLLRGS